MLSLQLKFSLIYQVVDILWTIADKITTIIVNMNSIMFVRANNAKNQKSIEIDNAYISDKNSYANDILFRSYRTYPHSHKIKRDIDIYKLYEQKGVS